jgi:hypothetical protein
MRENATSGLNDTMNPDLGSQQSWQRLGEIDLADWEDETTRMRVRTALSQSMARYVTFDEMQAPLESAIFDALARKAPAKASACAQRLIISCLAPAESSDASLQESTGWSFFVIERPAVQQPDGAVETIELCLYHE